MSSKLPVLTLKEVWADMLKHCYLCCTYTASETAKITHSDLQRTCNPWLTAALQEPIP